MNIWRRYFWNEARSALLFGTLLALAALAAFWTVGSQAAERLLESPVSPVSPIGTAAGRVELTPTPVPPATVVSLGLESYLWIAVVALIVVGVAIWVFSSMRRGT